jgi:protein-arginine kinase activator protein McsA
MLSKAAIRKRAQRAHPKMTACSICGGTDRLHRHHPDYTKPETVVIVCCQCHATLDAEDGTRTTKAPKRCETCGATFTEYSHSRVKNCSPQCLSEAGRRNALKRWGGGALSHPSAASPLA